MISNKELDKAVDEAYHKHMAHPVNELFNFVLLAFIVIKLGMLKELIFACVVACIFQGVTKAIIRSKLKRRFKKAGFKVTA